MTDDKVPARVVRKFHVYATREGGKETRRDFKAGQDITCTAEQFAAGKVAGLLDDPPVAAEPADHPEATAQA
jgi:hypothetical protein